MSESMALSTLTLHYDSGILLHNGQVDSLHTARGRGTDMLHSINVNRWTCPKRGHVREDMVSTLRGANAMQSVAKTVSKEDLATPVLLPISHG